MIYKELNEKEIEEFKKWARDNYVPNSEINSAWHPVVKEECKKINIRYNKLLSCHEQELQKQWEKDIAEKLIGRTIAKVEYMSKFEAEDYGWYKRPIIITLDDGKILSPMADDEGNNGGAIATTYKDLPTIPVL